MNVCMNVRAYAYAVSGSNCKEQRETVSLLMAPDGSPGPRCRCFASVLSKTLNLIPKLNPKPETKADEMKTLPAAKGGERVKSS